MSNRYVHKTTELKKIIQDNPELPLVILADGDDTRCLDYYGRWLLQSEIKCEKGVILNCELCWTHNFYINKNDFKEDLSEYICEKYDGLVGETELEKITKERLKKYEEYWEEAIIVKVSN